MRYATNKLKGKGYSMPCRVPRLPLWGLLNEKYGILDRDTYFREQLEQLSTYYYDMSRIYEEYNDSDIIYNLTSWLYKLTIVIKFDYNTDNQPDIYFDHYDNFKLNNDKTKVLSATIVINPMHQTTDDIYQGIYHEIKHIYDHLIIKSTDAFKENLFKELIISKELDIRKLTIYNDNLIYNIDTYSQLMNIIGNFLFNIEKSECSAYLENIDQEYKTTLNDKALILQCLRRGYNNKLIRRLLFRNSLTTNYLQIYLNIEKYINEIIQYKSEFFDDINKEYKQNFNDIYNVNSIQKVLDIYLKRINDVKIRARKLFNDRYENSYFQKICENYSK